MVCFDKPALVCPFFNFSITSVDWYNKEEIFHAEKFRVKASANLISAAALLESQRQRLYIYVSLIGT